MSHRDGDKRGYLAWDYEAERRKPQQQKDFEEMWGDYYPVISGQVKIRCRRAASVMTTNQKRG